MDDDHHIWSYVHYVAFLRNKVFIMLENDSPLPTQTNRFLVNILLSSFLIIRIQRKTAALSPSCAVKCVNHQPSSCLHFFELLLLLSS